MIAVVAMALVSPLQPSLVHAQETATGTLTAGADQKRAPAEVDVDREADVFAGVEDDLLRDDLDQLLLLAERAHWLKGVGGTAGFDCFVEPSQSLISHAGHRSVEGFTSRIQLLRQLPARLVVPSPAG